MKTSILALVLGLVMSQSLLAQNDTVLFSASGGFYEETFSLVLFNYYPQNHIRYTINGNPPTAQSPLYEEPLSLNEQLYSKSDIYTIHNCPETEYYLPDSVQHCIVIRAAVFDENDSCISAVKTNSYFIRALGCDTHGLPAVSLCADTLDLFDYYRGIFVPGVCQSSSMPNWTGYYFGRGMAWERRCNVEYYETDNRGVNQEAGLRTHGGSSRRLQQKGMKLYAREEYGKKRFKHRFFEDIPIEKFKRLTLKPFRCSNWLQIGLNDALCHQVARHMNIDVLGTRAVVVFLNGEYWGIYYLEESTDAHYLEDHYDIESDSCNIIKNWCTLDEGDDTQWQLLYDWLETADLRQAENYEYLCSKIDMDNFIDYLIFELYSANVDWPANNVRCWQSGERKWRWIFYDGDGCFFREWDVFANILDTSNNAGSSNAASTLFYRRLLDSPVFLEQFHSRFEEAMTYCLNYETTAPVLATLRERINDEVPNQGFRFNFPTSNSVWLAHLEQIDDFLRGRNQSMEMQIKAFMNVFSYEEPVGFVVYPNPFTDEIRLLVLSEMEMSKEVTITDMLGHCVYHEDWQVDNGVQHFVIHPNLTPGMYILKVGNYVQRIVKY